MAKISRKGDMFFIRTQLSVDQIKFYSDFDAWCYLHRVTIAHAAGTSGTTISFDIGMLDPNIAYLFRAICEIEKDERNEE